MLPHSAAIVGADRARGGGQVTVEKLAERALADEADAGGVLLLCVGQADVGGQFSHLGLVQMTQRKQRARKLCLVEPVKEIALILGRVVALEQLELAVACARLQPGLVVDDAAFAVQQPHACIVTGGNVPGA